MPRIYRKGRPRAVPESARTAWKKLRQPWHIGPLSRALGISRAAVSQWQHVPEDRVEQVAALIGVAPHALRPDIYKGAEGLTAPALHDYLNPPKEK